MAGIRDVAARAGVSIATVSRVLSSNGYVSDGARSSVLRAAEELHYIPNTLARGLKTNRSGLVALLIPQIVSPYFVALARGVEDVANKNGYHLIICNTDESVDKQVAYLDLLISRAVEGVIVASVNRSPKPLGALIARKTPVVLVDRFVDEFPADIVRGDGLNGMNVLTRYMLSLGHRRIAFVNGDINTSTAADRLEGFRAAYAQGGLSIDERLVSNGKWLVDDAASRLAGLLDREVRFTAVLGANHFMSIGAIRTLRERGLSVPKDVALAGFDDVELASEIDPFLTVMTQPVYTMGTFAMNMLLERISGSYPGPGRDVILAPWLVVRRSCGAQARQQSQPIPAILNQRVPIRIDTGT